LNVHVIKIIQHQIPIFLTKFSAKELVKISKVAVWSIKHRKNYQRPIHRLRVDNAATYIKTSDSLFPQSILLNSRLKVKFRKISQTGSTEFGTLAIPTTLWVVDGQHRLMAIKTAMEDISTLESFPIPVSIINVNKKTEQKLFYIINERQKGVKTDLVQQLIWSMAKMDPKQAPTLLLLEGKKYFMGLAVPVVEALNKKSSSPWKGKVRLAYESKKSKYQAPQNLMVRAIGWILQHRTTISDKNMLIDFSNRLISYWNAIKEIYPTAFKNPDMYTIQRSAGINCFSKIFPNIEAICEEKNDVSKKSMKKVLQQVKKNLDKSDRRHKGSLFWHKIDGNDKAKSTNMKSVNELVQIMLRGIKNY